MYCEVSFWDFVKWGEFPSTKNLLVEMNEEAL
jgi:hypothetical protein